MILQGNNHPCEQLTLPRLTASGLRIGCRSLGELHSRLVTLSRRLSIEAAELEFS